MIDIVSVALTPQIVTVGQTFLVSVEAAYTSDDYKWGDISTFTWQGIKAHKWEDFFTYRDPDHRETRLYSGAFICGQSYTF
ncbi:MAG: hypothetical protein ACOX4U_00425 [Anaerovoracaceae bacterium]